MILASPYLYLSLLTFIVPIITQQKTIQLCYRDQKCYQINHYTFKQKWNSDLYTKLNQVQQLLINQLKLSQDQYSQMLSHKLPKIKKIKFISSKQHDSDPQIRIQNVLTPKIIKTIFTSEYFHQLDELDLSSTNIDFRHLSFLNQTNITLISNLKVLKINDNFFDKRAFKLLSKINFNGNLRKLEIAGSSLIDQQSIDSIIKIIKPANDSKATITNLNVQWTSITADNLIKLLQNIHVGQIKQLNIGRNAFQHSLSYKIPFNNTVFQYLSSCNFSSLKTLNLNQLDLDEQQLPYLKNLKLPSLQTLQINQNFITDQYLTQWITKENMPFLKQLHMSKNSLTDLGIKSLVQQNFPYLEGFDISRNRKLSESHLYHLSQLNSSNWKYLDLSSNAINQKFLKSFFLNKPFQNLQALKMQHLLDSSNLFQYIPWETMRNLKKADFLETQLSQSVKFILKNGVNFPLLQVWKFGWSNMSQNIMGQFLKRLNEFGPSLQLFETTNLISAQQNRAYINISALNFDKIPRGAYIKITDAMLIHKPWIGDKFQVIEMIMKDKVNAEKLGYINTFFDGSFFSGDFSFQTDSFDYALPEKRRNLDKAVDFLNLIADFSCIEVVELTNKNDFRLLGQVIFKQSFLAMSNEKSYMTELMNFALSGEQINQTVYLPYLRSLSFVRDSRLINEGQKLYLMNKLKAPLLRHIQVQVLRSQEQAHMITFWRLLLNRNCHINSIEFISDSLSFKDITLMFGSTSLNYLTSFVYRGQMLDGKCLNDIQKRNLFVRTLQLKSTRLISEWFEFIMGQTQLMLEVFTFTDFNVGDAGISQISHLNQQFLTKLEIARLGGSIQGFDWFVGNISGRLFPKMTELTLDILGFSERQVDKLFSTGLPHIKYMNIPLPPLSNSAINTAVAYPNKLIKFVFLYGDLLSLNKGIDKRVLRHVKHLTSASFKFQVQDFQILSRMEMPNLQFIELVVMNIYGCEILQHILKIVKNVDTFFVTIDNSRKRGSYIHDRCLLNPSKLQGVEFPHLRQKQLNFQQQRYYIPKFYSSLYSSNAKLDASELNHQYLLDDTMINLFERFQSNELRRLNVSNNRLTDKFLDALLQKTGTNAQIIDLSYNQITLTDLKSINGKVFPQLQQLYLGSNPIIDETVGILTMAYFPKLQTLDLSGSDIGVKGLIKLLDLNAPKLRHLSLQRTLLNQDDLVYIAEYVNLDKIANLISIGTDVEVDFGTELQIRGWLERKYEFRYIDISYQRKYVPIKNRAILQI